MRGRLPPIETQGLGAAPWAPSSAPTTDMVMPGRGGWSAGAAADARFRSAPRRDGHTPTQRGADGRQTPVFRSGPRGSAPSYALAPISSPSLGQRTAHTAGTAWTVDPARVEPEDPQRLFRVALAGIRDPATARTDVSDQVRGPFGEEAPLALRPLREDLSRPGSRGEQLLPLGRAGGALAPGRADSRGGLGTDALSVVAGGRSARGARTAAGSAGSARASRYGVELPDMAERAELRYCCERYDSGCLGARLATRLCFSCKRLEPARPRSGFYCEACFLKRHPWTRMAHNWVAYAQQEPPRPAERTPKQEKQAAAVSRLLESTRTAAKSLEDVTTSTFSERRSAARHCDGLMERMLGLISAMRDDGQRQRLHAVRVIGSAWRAFVARRFVTRATRRMWASAVDVTTGRTYYINRRTGDTQWTQPRTFFGALVDRIGRYPRVLAEDMNPDVAATRIQGMFRGFKAKTKLRSLVRSTWRVIPEEGGERKYYFNTVSLATQWNRPLLLGPEADDHLFALRRGTPGRGRCSAGSAGPPQRPRHRAASGAAGV